MKKFNLFKLMMLTLSILLFTIVSLKAQIPVRDYNTLGAEAYYNFDCDNALASPTTVANGTAAWYANFENWASNGGGVGGSSGTYPGGRGIPNGWTFANGIHCYGTEGEFLRAEMGDNAKYIIMPAMPAGTDWAHLRIRLTTRSDNASQSLNVFVTSGSDISNITVLGSIEGGQVTGSIHSPDRPTVPNTTGKITVFDIGSAYVAANASGNRIGFMPSGGHRVDLYQVEMWFEPVANLNVPVAGITPYTAEATWDDGQSHTQATNTIYSENFDSWGSNALNAGWHGFQDGTAFSGNSNGYMQRSSSGCSGSSIRLYANYNSGILITPAQSVDVNSGVLSFCTRREANTNPVQTLEVGYLTDVNNASSFVSLKTINAATDCPVEYDPYSFTVNLSSVPAGVNHIAWRHNSNGVQGTASWMWIDDVNIEQLVAPILPQYHVEWGLEGFTPGTGAEIGSTITYNAHYEMTGLQPQTNYTVAVCLDPTANCWITYNFATALAGGETFGDGIWNGYVFANATRTNNIPAQGDLVGIVHEQPQFTRNTTPWSGNSAVAQDIWFGTAPSDNIFVRYKMTYDFPQGSYKFFIGTDDYVRLSVDGGATWLPLNNGDATTNYWTVSNGTFSNLTNVALNGPTDLVFEFYEGSGGNEAKISWMNMDNVCTYNMVLSTSSSSYGWYYASLQVMQDGIQVQNIPSQGSFSGTRNIEVYLEKNKTTSINVNKGSYTPYYDNYAQWEFKTPDGVVAASKSSNNPFQIGEDCAPCLNPVITIANITNNSFDLNLVPGNGFNVKISTTELADPATDVANAFTGNTPTNTLSISGMQANTTYYVYVQKDCESGWVSTSVLTLPNCNNIENFAIDGAIVSWTASTNASSYELQYKKSSETEYTAIMLPGTAVSYDFSSFPSGYAYDVRLRAICGEGDYSWWSAGFFVLEGYGTDTWNGFIYHVDRDGNGANPPQGAFLGVLTESDLQLNKPNQDWDLDSPDWGWESVSIPTPNTDGWAYPSNPKKDHFILRLKRIIDFPCGNYTFTIKSDDKIRVSFDGGETWALNAFWDNSECCNEKSDFGSLYLSGAKNVVIESFENGGNWDLKFLWNYTLAGVAAANIINIGATKADIEFPEGTIWGFKISSAPINPATQQGDIANIFATSSYPYHITGLTAQTTYYIYARSECNLNWSNTTFTTGLCNGPCIYTLEAWDSYGDTWNNGRLIISQGGAEVLNYSVTYSGTTHTTMNVALCSDVAANLTWTGGSYPGENRFILRDPSGSTVYEKGSSTTNINYNFTPFCAAVVPPCELTNLTVSDITTNSAKLTWTGNATSYEVQYKPTTIGWDDAFVGFATTYTNEYNFANVTGLTTVDVRVRSICGDNVQSNWTIAQFSLLPDTTVAPITCEFTLKMWDTYGDSWNGGEVTILQNGTTYGPYSVPDDGGYGNGNVLHTETVYLISGVAATVVYTAGSWADENVFELLDGDGNILASKNSGSADSFETTINPVCPSDSDPSCDAPINIIVAPAATSATISWNGTGNFYIIEYGPQGFVHGSGTIIYAYYTHSAVINGLNDDDAYSVYVKQVCSEELESTWTSVINFVTYPDCSQPKVLPYSEDFESYTGSTYSTAGTIPDCWYTTNASGKSVYFPHITGSGSYHYPHSGSKALTFTAGSSSYGGANTYAVLPAFDKPISQVGISFWRRMESSSAGTLTIGYITGSQNDISTYVPVVTVPNTTTVTAFTYDFSTATQNLSNATHIVLRWSYSTSYYSCGVDDINVYSLTCLASNNFVVDNVTSSSVDLSWDAVSNGYNYEIEYGPTGFTVGTGTVVVTSNNSISITGLQHATPYTFYLKTFCGLIDGESVTVPASAITLCDGPIAALPWTEGFEAYPGTTYSTAGVLPQCWSSSINGTAYPAPHVYGSSYGWYPHSGTKNLGFVANSSANSAFAVLPAFAESLNNLSISFWYRHESGSYGQITLGYITGEDNDMTNFVSIADLPRTTTLSRFVYNLSNVPSIENATRLVLRYYHNSTWYTAGVDDFEVRELVFVTTTASCPSDITGNSHVTFTPNNPKVIYNEPNMVKFTVGNHFIVEDVLINGVSSIGSLVSLGGNNYAVGNFTANATVHVIVAMDPNAHILTFNVHTGKCILNGENIDATNGVVTRTVAMLNDDIFDATFFPADGYHGLTVKDGVDMGAINEYVIFNYTGGSVFDLYFAKNTYSITTHAYGNGSITDGVPSFEYDPAYVYEYTATPNEGYHLANFTVNGIVASGFTPEGYTGNLTNILQNYNLEATFQINTYEITATAGVGGSISPLGTTLYQYGQSVEYVATADNGRFITSIIVDGEAVVFDANATVWTVPFTNIAANHTIQVLFGQNEYTITATAGAGGTISPTGALTVNYGANSVYTITPNAGYEIASVLVDGVNVGALPAYTFTNIAANHTISATFVHLQYTLYASVNNTAAGTITPNGITNKYYGESQTYTLTTNTGYTRTNVLVNGVPVTVSNNQFTVSNIMENKTIVAMYERNTYNVTVTQPTNGVITPAGVTTVNHGSNMTFTVTPNTGYEIQNIKKDGTNVPTTQYSVNANGMATYTLTNITANTAITATMLVKTFTITATAGSNGSITPSGTEIVNYGNSKTYTITPSAGYQIANVKIDGVSVGAISTYTFTNVRTNHTISAEFTTVDCETPSYLSATDITSSTAVIKWIGSAESYDLYYRQAGSDNFSQVVVNDTTHVLINLQPNTRYHYFLLANCGNGVYSDTSLMLSFITLPATANTHTIVATAGINGTITPSGNVTITEGHDQMFVLIPNAGYVVASLIVDGNPVVASQYSDNIYRFTNVTSDHTITVSFATVGIYDYDNKDAIALYPNPTTNMLTVEVPVSVLIDHSTMLIFNNVGSLVGTYTIVDEKTQINVSNLSAGMYFLKIGNTNVKFIKE
jgi:hypothetical protein